MQSLSEISVLSNGILVLVDGLRDDLELSAEERNFDYQKIEDKAKRILGQLQVTQKQLDIAKHCL